jgi:hypothetical protein
MPLDRRCAMKWMTALILPALLAISGCDSTSTTTKTKIETKVDDDGSKTTTKETKTIERTTNGTASEVHERKVEVKDRDDDRTIIKVPGLEIKK